MKYSGKLIRAIPPTTSTGYDGTSSGMFGMVEVQQLIAANSWPKAPTIPGTPTVTGVIAGDAQVEISFTAPTDTGGLTITSYTATSSPGNITATGNSSPITVTGLTNDTTYTFTVKATNSKGTGPESSQSSNATPTGARIVVINGAPYNIDTTPVSLTTPGTYTLTVSKSITASVKLWGAGGSSTARYSGGAGGSATGDVSLNVLNSYVIVVGSAAAGSGGGGNSTRGGRGGGYSGLFNSSVSQGNALIIAGGGGGAAYDDGGRGARGGAGGGDSGQAAAGYGVSWGGGGTQSAGGAKGDTDDLNGSQDGVAGSQLQGGAGGSESVNSLYGGGAGGGGYWGGGGGGIQFSWAGGGGGGGSGYVGGISNGLINGVNYAGNTTTPGNSGDANRGSAGNVQTDGKFYIY